jgi:hypothetical protein
MQVFDVERSKPTGWRIEAQMVKCIAYIPDADTVSRARLEAAAAANAEDASVWRWFSAMLEERRIRWRFAFDTWAVQVDKRHTATKPTFYEAIRAAKDEAQELGIGLL